MKTIFLALIFAFGVSGYEEKAGTIRIDLKRQKTPWEQYLKYSTQFKEFGIHLDRDTNLTNSTVPVYRYLDNEFYGKISLGNPGQCMNVALDTSWSLSWVISSKCGTFTTGCLFHNKYDHDISSSYKKDGRPYSADAFNGFYSYDSISVGQTNVTTFSFVEMVGVPNSLFSNKADGALGLGLKYGDYEPFVYALYRQKKIREPIFSIYLNSDRQSKSGGSVMLGFIDEKLIHKTQYPNKTVIPDKIKYLSVDEGITWKFSVDSIVITPNQSIPMKNVTLCEKGCKAISDTSTNQIYGPLESINKINSLINAQKFLGRWTVKCGTISKLPRIDFVLGGQRFSLDGTQYIMKTSYMWYTICISPFATSEYSTDDNSWILGGAFLSQYYSIYNIEEKTIGFVKAA